MLRAPRWLPRAELYWDQGARYRLLREPEVTLDEWMPNLRLGEQPLVEGRIGLKLQVDGAAFFERDGIESIADRFELRRGFLTTGGVLRLLRRPLYYNLEFGVLQKDF